MVRSEALKKAQKKYYDKIVKEKGPVFEKMRAHQKDYQKKYNKKIRQNPEKLKKIRAQGKVNAKNYYYNNKQHVLNRRKELRDIKQDNDLLDFLTNNLIEISLDE